MVKRKVVVASRGAVVEFAEMEARLKRMQAYSPESRMPKTEDQMFDWLNRILCELSPENLHCDGEISRTAARKKQVKLNREWKEVEKLFGRKVAEDEIYARLVV